MGLEKPVVNSDGPMHLSPCHYELRPSNVCFVLCSFVLSVGRHNDWNGPVQLDFHRSVRPDIRLLCFLPKLSPFHRAIRVKALLYAGKSTSAPSCSEEMVKAIRIHELGGAEVLKWEDVEVGEPKEGEIRVRNKAIGVNFIDVYFRKGVYKAPSLPFIPGREAVGEVVAVGPGLTDRKVGDIVAYAGHPMGSYAEEQILAASVAIPVPPSIDPVVAASAMLKGMTTQFLVRRCFKVERGHTVLIQAAAGGVGSLLCQWANALGATVIGTVSTREKADQARADGCHHTILYTEEDVVSRVNEITSGNGVDVVYDAVGKTTFEGSLACLKVRGYMVSYGQSSGSPDPIAVSALASKSLFLTRPTMFHYTRTRDELMETAGEVFANIASGVLRVRTNHTYALADAAKAHSDLEGRKTSGSIVLIP